MARYIDADKLWNARPIIPKCKSQDYIDGFTECMFGFSKRIKEQIDNTPTADVVPRAEVTEIFADIEKECVDRFGCFSYWKYAKIKQKYTEGGKTE